MKKMLTMIILNSLVREIKILAREFDVLMIDMPYGSYHFKVISYNSSTDQITIHGYYTDFVTGETDYRSWSEQSLRGFTTRTLTAILRAARGTERFSQRIEIQVAGPKIIGGIPEEEWIDFKQLSY